MSLRWMPQNLTDGKSTVVQILIGMVPWGTMIIKFYGHLLSVTQKIATKLGSWQDIRGT